MDITVSEIRVGFHGEGGGSGELTWGQMGIWRASQRNGKTMNLVWPLPLPEGTPLSEIVAMLRFKVSRHPALRTRLRFADGPAGDRHPRQVIAESGEVPLHVVDIDDGDDPAAAAEELRSRYELTYFDYENEFPVRTGVIRQSGRLAQLVVGYSHVMVDGGGLDALNQDLRHLDRSTGEATAPPEGLNPLDLARKQGSPGGRRQSDRAIQYWADQLGRLPAWRLEKPARPQAPPFWELVAYSPAMELGIRAVAARTGADATSVLLAAYSVAIARVFGRNPSVAQIVTSNRFRPGLADMVSQVSQHGICVVDAAGASFDEVVARAQKAVTSASFYAYYDPVACDGVLGEIAAQQGQSLDISWCLNDRRGVGPAEADVEVPTEAEVTKALPHSKLFWDRKEPAGDGAMFLHVDSQPLLAARQDLAEGLPAVYMQVWVDTRQFTLDQADALAREMESAVVAAARDT